MTRIGTLIVGALLLSAGAAPVAAQDKHDIGGMMLTNQMGELCTMCEADMTCTTPEGVATSYHFQKRGFVGQMLTVLDYFPFTRQFGLRHTRPVTISAADSKTTGEAAMDLTTKRIEVPDAKGASTWVDRTTGQWHGAGDSVIGQCTASKI